MGRYMKSATGLRSVVAENLKTSRFVTAVISSPGKNEVVAGPDLWLVQLLRTPSVTLNHSHPEGYPWKRSLLWAFNDVFRQMLR
jgi:hypothetical protein